MAYADDTMATVASFVERLQSNKSSSSEKELITARLLTIAKERKEAGMLIGSHSQAMPLFTSILRSGTTVPKVHVAMILSVMCKDDELCLWVLLGGCIQPLLSMLKSQSTEVQRSVVEATYEASSALDNLYGGISSHITYLEKLSQSSSLVAPVSNAIGALDYVLMVCDGNASLQEEPFKVSNIKCTLVMLLEPQEDKLAQDCVLEAMASLYGDTHLSEWIFHVDPKRVLIGLTLMAAVNVREHFIRSLIYAIMASYYGTPWEERGHANAGIIVGSGH
ncbi:hypothetical protein MLD38_034030 [Melastoma candidum]|uniref:Uncharacterized protein n=1 Tax=Melastoma candidum TaxID=119954 RepID=A0ACB9M8M8_9MYRT|nr:hypothetical protein MLD38_034030 [Melastoma candidum]